MIMLRGCSKSQDIFKTYSYFGTTAKNQFCDDQLPPGRSFPHGVTWKRYRYEGMGDYASKIVRASYDVLQVP